MTQTSTRRPRIYRDWKVSVGRAGKVRSYASEATAMQAVEELLSQGCAGGVLLTGPFPGAVRRF